MSARRLVGLRSYSELIRSRFQQAARGKGSIIAVRAESGYGKTSLLTLIDEETDPKNSPIATAYSAAAPPIGKIDISNMQPLLTIAKALEALSADKKTSPEKRFAYNLGMTMLSSLPIAGEVFYAVKEVGRDYRDFKKDKSSRNLKNVSSITADYYDSIKKYLEKTPLALLLDDMQWADAHTMELLTHFAEEISALPLVIVYAYRPSALQGKVLPLTAFVNKRKTDDDNHATIELPGLSNSSIRELAGMYLPGYAPSQKFEDWLMVKSLGAPAIVAEYLKFFKTHSPFDEKGEFKELDQRTDFLPASMQAAFAGAVESLTEDELNLLAICSAEGIEFTALIVSQLLNTDILTTIRKLRGLQNKTDFFQSIGPKIRYGSKTTVYKFSQGFYQSFFENQLEYEEYQALHGQIAAILKQKFDESATSEVQNQIAPYLAAHSAESGDRETAKEMMLLAAEGAEDMGASGVVEDIYDNFVTISDQTRQFEENDDGTQRPESAEESAFAKLMHKGELEAQLPGVGDIAFAKGMGGGYPVQSEAFDYPAERAEVVRLYEQGDLLAAANRAMSAVEDERLAGPEQIQMLTIAARAFTDLEDYARAEELLNRSLSQLENYPDLQAECFALNAAALTASARGKFDEANEFLERAARKSIALSPQLRLLTVANIANILKDYAPERAAKYLKAARQLAANLQFHEFAKDLE